MEDEKNQEIENEKITEAIRAMVGVNETFYKMLNLVYTLQMITMICIGLLALVVYIAVI